MLRSSPRRAAPLFALLVGCNAILDIGDHARDDDHAAAGMAGVIAARGGNNGSGGRSGRGGSTGLAGGAIGTAGDGLGGSDAGTDSGSGGRATIDPVDGIGADGALGGRGSLGAGGTAAGGANSAGSTSQGGATLRGGSSSISPGSGGTSANTCTPACTGSKLCENQKCVDCRNAERSCASDGTPLLCAANVWTKQAACSGATPLCSNGTCVGTRLIGGVVETQGSLSRGSVRLVEQSLSIGAASCSTAVGKCVVGGIRP